MKLFDSADRAAIEVGLKRVFGWGDYGQKKINQAIAAQVFSNLPWCVLHIPTF
jgi:hypothetical protein